MTEASTSAGRVARLRDLPAAVRIVHRAETAAYGAGRNGVLRGGFGWRTTIAASVVFSTLLGWQWISDDRTAVVTVTPVPARPTRPWRGVAVTAAVLAVLVAVPVTSLVLLAAGVWVLAATVPHMVATRRRRPAAASSGWGPFGAGRPVWYLAGAASNGAGTGQPLWAALLADADQRGVALVAETSGEDRIGYYRTGGFDVAAHGQDGTVVLTRMPAGPDPAS